MSASKLSNCSHKVFKNNCKNCSIYIHPENKAIKTENYDSIYYTSSEKYLKNLRKNMSEVLSTVRLCGNTVKFLRYVCQKYSISLETQVLGLYIMGKAVNMMEKQQKNIQLIGCTSLMVACKAIELDINIPLFYYISQNCQEQIQMEQYEAMQQKIMKICNFNFQSSTFITFINFYLVNGVVFEKDELTAQQVNDFQIELINKSKKMLDEGKFLTHNPQKLAISLIKQNRSEFKLNPWNKQLDRMTGYQAKTISVADCDQTLTPLNYLIFRKKNNNSKISRNESPAQSSTTKFQRKNNTSLKKKGLKKQNNHKLIIAQNKLAQMQNLDIPKQKRSNIFMISVPKYLNATVSNQSAHNQKDKNNLKLSYIRKTLSRQKLKPLMMRR